MPEIKENIQAAPRSRKLEKSPEHILSPEKFIKQQAETAVEKAPETAAPISPVVLPSETSTAVASNDAIILQKVENILSHNMDRVFLSMDAATQQQFKAKGEATARQIVGLLSKTKIKLKELVSVIMSWLRIIPHVNKFYLEQEAKIKADEIIKMHQAK